MIELTPQERRRAAIAGLLDDVNALRGAWILYTTYGGDLSDLAERVTDIRARAFTLSAPLPAAAEELCSLIIADAKLANLPAQATRVEKRRSFLQKSRLLGKVTAAACALVLPSFVAYVVVSAFPRLRTPVLIVAAILIAILLSAAGNESAEKGEGQ